MDTDQLIANGSICLKFLMIGLILATRETKMFAHLTVPKQQMFDKRSFHNHKTLRLFGAKNQNNYCLKYRAFTFQRFSKIHEVLLSTIHCCSSVLIIGVFNYNIFMRVKFIKSNLACFEYILESFEPFGLLFINMEERIQWTRNLSGIYPCMHY